MYAVPPQLFTANGTANGVITIATGACSLFKVKQKVLITATGLPTLLLEIKEIDSQDNIQVGPIAGTLLTPGANTGISARTDLSAYTILLGAAVSADEQKRPAIDFAELQRAMYDEEPSVAQRSILVDECGDRINGNNPLPVAFDGTVQIGDVSIVEGGNTMDVNSDGSINVNVVNSVPTSTPGLNTYYSEISSVASGASTPIITVVAPVGGYRLFKIDVSGENIALYTVSVNGTTISTLRTFFGALNTSFIYDNQTYGIKLNSGDTLVVTVLHTRPFVGNFEATVMGINL